MLAKDPDTTGSLGMAVSEAVEVAANDPEARYALGSVLNHVVLHQSVIGLEAVEQLTCRRRAPTWCSAAREEVPTWPGLAFPFLREKIHGRQNPRIVAAEPAACPSITQGEYRYDHGDVAGLTPLLKMHTLGMDFVPDPIHAGGLRYHGMSPALSHTVELGLVEGRGDLAERRLRRGCPVRPHAGHRARAGVDARHRGRRRLCPRARATRCWSSGCPATASWICRPTRSTCRAAWPDGGSAPVPRVF